MSDTCARSPHAARTRLPEWLKRTAATGPGAARVAQQIARQRLHTVCREARCPNRAECFARGTATFLILGRVCTRSCAFCGIAHGEAAAADPEEPRRLAEAARSLGLSFVVVTSVTRDDLPDQGAGQFAAVVRAVRERCPDAGIEVLIPDLGGRPDLLQVVLESRPDVLNHNVETVPRLYPAARPQADFERSIELLSRAAAHRPGLVVKSGMMVGLGERPEEVVGVLGRLKAAGCTIVTIGQYLQPTDRELPVAEFVTPERFDFYAREGRRAGIPQVIAGPFVRSSYRALESARSAGVGGI